MKISESFVKFISNCIGILIILPPVFGAVLFGIFNKDILSNFSPMGEELISFIFYLIIGVFCGLLFDIICFGPIIILLNILYEIEGIKYIMSSKNNNLINSTKMQTKNNYKNYPNKNDIMDHWICPDCGSKNTLVSDNCIDCGGKR